MRTNDTARNKYLILAGILLTLSSVCLTQNIDKKGIGEKIMSLKHKYEKMLPVGSTVSEVKGKMGNPNAVQAGFPDTDATIVTEIPEFHGQLNYSTFVYKLSNTLSHSWKETEGGGAVIDGDTVSEDVWNIYSKRDTITFDVGYRRFVKIRYPSGSTPVFEIDQSTRLDRIAIGDVVHPTKLGKHDLYVLSKAEWEETVKGVIVEEYNSIDSTSIKGVAAIIGYGYQIGKPKNQCVIQRFPVGIVSRTATLRPIVFVLFDRGTQVVAGIKVLLLLI